MRSTMRVLAVAILGALQLAAVPQANQTSRDEIYVYETNEVKSITRTLRLYETAAADTSIASVQITPSASAPCSCYVVPDTTLSGDRRRDSRWDVYSIAGADTLIYLGMFFRGSEAQVGSVDSASVQVGQIYSVHLADTTITNADMADDAVDNRVLANDAVASANIIAGTIDSTDVGSAKLSGSDLFTRARVAAEHDSLLWTHPDGGLSRAPIPASYVTGPMLTAYVDAMTKRFLLGPTFVADSMGVLGDFWARGDVYVGGDGTKILFVDNINPIVGSEIRLWGAPLMLGKTSGGTVAGELEIVATDGYYVSHKARAGMGAHKTIYDYSGPGTSGQVSVSDGSGPTFANSLNLTSTIGGTTISGTAWGWKYGAYAWTYNPPALTASGSSTTPILVAHGTVSYTDSSSPYRQAYYIAGILSTDNAQCTVNTDRWEISSPTNARFLIFDCKNDSLVASAAGSTSTDSFTIYYEIKRY